MFNNVHYFNAVKVNKLQGEQLATMTTGEANKNWYYVDVCYDDVNTERMAQTRVENAGLLRHVNFLVSPSGLEGRYSKYYITLTRCTMATPTPRTRIPMWMMTAMLC
ncbi:MAG: hypothetical protein ACLUJU_05320 [Subdoligranulum sp.]